MLNVELGSLETGNLNVDQSRWALELGNRNIHANTQTHTHHD